MPSKRTKVRRKRSDQKLNITSMMDMFTIILVFLLKSYSAEGQLITPASGLEVPISKTEMSAKPALEIKVSQSKIAVGDKIIASVDDVLKDNEMRIPALVDILLNEKEKAEMMAASMGEEFKGVLIIQGDKKMPYKLLTKVMYSCGQAGYSKQNFVVYKKE